MVGLSVASSHPPAFPKHHVTVHLEKSSGSLAVERPFDLHRFRTLFPDRWASFLRAHFRNHTQIAAFFDVDDKTARNWLDGTTKPTAPTALIAVASIPGAMAELTGVAA